MIDAHYPLQAALYMVAGLAIRERVWQRFTRTERQMPTVDRLAGRPVRKAAYDCTSCLNRWHMKWAWMSLFGVAFADLYVRLVSMGIWTDWRIL